MIRAAIRFIGILLGIILLMQLSTVEMRPGLVTKETVAIVSRTFIALSATASICSLVAFAVFLGLLAEYLALLNSDASRGTSQ